MRRLPVLRVFTSCESRRGSWNGRGYTTNHAHHSLCNSSHLATSRMSDLAVYLKSVDEQYKAGQWRENLENLDSYVESHKEALEEPEILWRIVRIYYKIGKYLPRDQKESEELSRKGYEYSEKSLKIDDKNFSCRKWAGIILNFYSDHAGQKVKIEKSFVIKEHFEKAIELDPTEPFVRHSLGRWCYNVASVPWYLRRAASLVFATPPTSSYEEALSHFEAAESVKAGFFSHNWLFLGKTHYQLSNREEARRWLTKVVELEKEGPEHKEAQDEARSLLTKL